MSSRTLIKVKALHYQHSYITSEATFPALVAGYGCVSANTKIYTEKGLIPICDITPTTKVLSLNHQTNQFELQVSSGAFPKGVAKMLQVSTPQGKFEAIGHHRIFSSDITSSFVPK